MNLGEQIKTIRDIDEYENRPIPLPEEWPKEGPIEVKDWPVKKPVDAPAETVVE